MLAEAHAEDEAERVHGWRLLQFTQLHFPDWQAELLADSGADHHEAERLLDRGCPPELAFELLT